MVSEAECPCTDATEASNIVSLQSDVSCAIDSELKDARSGSNEGNDTFGEYGIKDCKCYEVRPSANSTIPKTTEGRPASGKAEKSFQQDTLEDQSTVKQFPTTKPCFCQAHKISAYTLPVKYAKEASYSRPFWCRFKWKWPRKEHLRKKDKTYEVKLRQNQCPHYAKPFMCCEIAEGIPKRTKCEPPKSKPPRYRAKSTDRTDANPIEKIDVYYFDHGNSAYYRTTDCPPILATEKCAERTDQAATRFWAEIFGTIHIGTAFVTAFILQLLRFVLLSIIRPLTVGILQLFADYFVKPFLSIVFNALIQPFLILLYNVATSLKDLCEPLAEAMGLFLREFANVCAAIRIVEVKQTCGQRTTCT